MPSGPTSKMSSRTACATAGGEGHQGREIRGGDNGNVHRGRFRVD
jgi:hypothetical protein